MTPTPEEIQQALEAGDRETIQQDVLPCGCIARTELVAGERAFVFIPCSLDCEYLDYVRKIAAEEDKPFFYGAAP